MLQPNQIFTYIKSFVRDLTTNSDVASTNKPLKLYSYLLEKTTEQNAEPMKKHIEAFRTFLDCNFKAIEEKNISFISNDTVEYSTNVFINIKTVLEELDEDGKNVVWAHLKWLQRVMDPNTKEEDLVKLMPPKSESIVQSLVDKISSKINVESNNPQESVLDFLCSNDFTDMIKGLRNDFTSGKIKINDIKNEIKDMIMSVASTSNDPQQVMIYSLVCGAIDKFTDNKTGNIAMPDVSSLLSMFMK